MKKKTISVLLILCLLLTPSLNVSADTLTGSIIADTSDTNRALESSATTTYTAATPHGFLDSVDTDSIGGWAWRSDIPNTPIDVHIYIKEDATGDEWGYSVTANGYRPDLYNAGYGNGYHAFNKLISWMKWNPGSYTIRAYGIGANGDNPQLINSPKYYTVSNLTGNVEYVSNIGVGGWAWKASAPNEPVTIHVYVKRADGEVLGIYPTVANQARSDLLSQGYGNGNHGFTVSIDWSSLPRENLNVTVYAVDGTGIHPAIYDGHYNNRKAIYLIGTVDEEGYDRSEWMWSTDVASYCNNIGYSYLFRSNSCDNNGIVSSISHSSYSLISTHGTSDGKAIMWAINGDRTKYPEFGLCDIDYLNCFSNEVFSTTKCSVIMACYSGLNAQTNKDNFVNVLNKKGVSTVVGFRGVIYSYITSDDKIDPSLGSQLWATEFTRLLGEGYTVADAAGVTTKIVADTHLEFHNLTPIDLMYKTQEFCDQYIYCGLNNYYIAGDSNQIIKH